MILNKDSDADLTIKSQVGLLILRAHSLVHTEAVTTLKKKSYWDYNEKVTGDILRSAGGETESWLAVGKSHA